MSIIFSKLEQHAKDLQRILGERAFVKDEQHPFPWDNLIYESAFVRLAHLDVVDRRDTKKLYMMHLCVFPKTHDPAPIYGFDLIAGPNKITGAFLDFSPIGDPDHPLCNWFANEVKEFDWSRPRDLPDWARPIFSKSMVAAGNIQNEFELNAVLDLSKRSLIHYLQGLYITQGLEPYELKVKKYNYTKQQNAYCINQKKNPHTPRVMESLGFDPKTVQDFIQNCLFPEV